MRPKKHKISWPSRALNSKELDDLLIRTIREVKLHPNIDGLIVMGSYAMQRQDKNSDVDLVIITRNDVLATSVSEWKTYLSSLSTVLVMDELDPLAWVPTLESTAVGVVKIDYDFITTENINDEVQKAVITQTGLSHGEILFDRSGILAQAYTPSKPSSNYHKYPITTMDQFIITAWSVIRMLDRGEVFEAFDILITLRDPHILSLITQLHNVPFENYRRIEDKIDVSWQNKITRTFCGPVPDKIALACIDIVELYKSLWEKLGNHTTDSQKAIMQVMVDALVRIQENQGKS